MTRSIVSREISCKNGGGLLDDATVDRLLVAHSEEAAHFDRSLQPQNYVNGPDFQLYRSHP